MIGNFEIKKPDINLCECVVNMADYSEINNLYLCPAGTTFTTSQFANERNWTDRLVANTIYQVRNVFNVTSQSEEQTLNESKFNFRWELKPGKYRFLMYVNVDIEYFKKLKKLEGLRHLYFTDINNNLYGVLSGSNVLPFDLDLISIQKISFGTNQAALVGIVIDLHDAKQVEGAYIIKPDWETDELVKTWWNENTLTGDFTKNDCTSPSIGTSVSYTVLPDSYSSTSSQEDADAIALHRFNIDGQKYANDHGLCIVPVVDVYACVNGGGDIYKQTASAGDFIALGQTSRFWRGMTTSIAGDVYACVDNGDIYKQTSGAGDFIALSQISTDWSGMASSPNGDVYACANNENGVGDIYKQSGGTGDFIALGQTHREWSGMAITANGDVYACDNGGDIYKQSGGTGDFIALGQTHRDWTDMTVSSNGDVYACVNGSGDIYKQTGGTGDFIALSQTARSWSGMAAASNGNVYACVAPGNIYKQTGGTGDFVSLAQTNRVWLGMTTRTYIP